MASSTQQRTDASRPFSVVMPHEALEDLRRRIAATRWPSMELVEDRSPGAQLATLRAEFQPLRARMVPEPSR